MTYRPVIRILKIFIAAILNIFLFCAAFPSIVLSSETCPQEALSPQCNVPLSSNASNFNGTTIAAGRYIWFNSIVKVNGRGGNPAVIRFAGSKISFSAGGKSYDLAVPDAEIVFSPAVSMATTDFTDCKWVTTVPLGYTGNVFLSGLAFQIPEGGLPGGINPVTWSGHFMTQTSGIAVQWKWAAAVYTQFSGDNTGIGVKPVDGNTLSQYNNSDHAGTPENFKPYVTGGARGGGGSNYTGSYSGTVSNNPTLDTTPPGLTVATLPDGSWTNNGSLTISGQATDNTCIQRLTVNGAVVTIEPDGNFIHTVTLQSGPNTIIVTAADLAGNQVSDTRTINLDNTAPLIKITSPAAGSYTNKNTTPVTGTVSDGIAAQVTVNGLEAAVSQDTFVIESLPLIEGANTIRAIAIDSVGNSANDEITVVSDTVPPVITIDPTPEYISSSVLELTGNIDDITATTVTVQGQNVSVPAGGGTFSFTVNLTEGMNTLTVSAVDSAGNASEAVRTITSDTIAPEVTGFSILADPKVTLNIPVSITFTEEPDASTVNLSNITLQSPSGSVSGSFSISGTEVIFTPDNELAANETYTLTVSTGVKDKAGNSLAAAFIGTFETLRGAAFILGEVYDDTLGLPLQGAEVRVLLINNEVPDPPFLILTDVMGRFSFNYEGASGEALIEILKAGYTKALRRAPLQPNRSYTVFDIRLTPAKTQTVSAAAGGSLASGDTILNIPANALIQDTDISLAILSQQGMGYRLPIGWSPLFGADTSPWGTQLNTPGRLSIKNIWGIQSVVAAFFDEDTMSWVSAAASISGDNIIVEVNRLGQYFLLIPDTLPFEPPLPSAAGEPIQPSMDAVPDGVTADVELIPPAVLSEEGAHGMTTVIATALSPLPSGTHIEARVSEKYNLTAGEVITPEPFTEDITLYNWPDDGDINTLSAQFPATPSKTYPFGILYYGKVDIDISMPSSGSEGDGDVTGDSGGTITGPGGLSIIIPPSSLTDDTVFSLHPLSEQELPVSGPDGLTFLGAMVLQMQGGSFISGAYPEFIISGLLTEGMEVIITRVETINGESVLTAVAVGRIETGKIKITRCLTVGCITSGQYAFYNPVRPVGFITGQVNKSDALVAGAVVTVDNLPFRSQTDINGNFTVLTLSGSYTITASEPDTGLTASAAGNVEGGESIFVQLTLSSTRPAVSAITPHDKETAVALTTGIEVTFSEPINPNTVNSASFQLIKDAPGIDVNPIQVKGYFSLKSGNTIAVFAPESALESETIYRVKLTEDILDNFGEPLLPFESVFTTAEVLGNEALDPGELTASMPDVEGYITIRGGPGLAAPGTPVVFFNRTKSITVTITAEPDGSFSGTIRADLGDKIEVHVKDLLDNTTILDPGIFQNPDGTAAVGPEGGTIHGPGGITTYIPDGAFYEFIAIKVTMVSEDVLQGVTIDPALRSAGVFQVDTGGVRANKELKISVPAPEWITPDHQVLITKVVNIRGFDELTLTCPAILQDGKLISTSPPFDGIYEGGTYGLTTWYNPETGVGFAMVETWSYYGAGYSLGEYGFSFAAPEHKRKIFPITVPVDKPYNVNLNSLDGTILDSVSIQGPPKRGEFIEGIIKLTDDTIPPVVWNSTIPDGTANIHPGEESISIEMNEPIDPSSVNNSTVFVTDSEGKIVEGTVYLAEDGKTIVFVPRYGYKYGETYTMHVDGIKDWGGNLITGYTSAFSTFNPEVIKTIEVPFAMAIDKFGNYVAVKGDDGMSLGIGLTRASMIEIFDVSDPLNPQTAGRQDLWGYMKDIKVVPDMGDYIVAVGGRADKEGFLDLINVTDPYNPTYHEGIYISWNPNYSGTPPEGVPFQGGSPAEVAVIGTNAYVANYGLGIQAVDLTAVTPPFETAQRNAIGGTITANSYSSVSKVRNNILAVKNGALQVLSPGLSVLGGISGLNWPGVVAGVERFPIDIDGDRNYGTYEDNDGDPTTSLQEEFDLALVTTSDGIVVIDVTTPSAPIKMDMIPIGAWKIEVDRERRMAFGLSGGGLSIISLKDLKPNTAPDAMGLRDSDGDNIDDRVLYTITEASGMDMVLNDDGSLAYVADYSGGLMKVVDLGVGTIPYDISPSSDITVTADDNIVEIILYEKNLSDNEPKEIRWFIEGGGSLSQTASTSTNGIFTTTLTTSTVAGAAHKIIPKLVKEDGSLEDIGISTGTIRVEPGLASEIKLTPSRTNYAADETGTVSIDAEVKDAYGNLVADGTAVSWSLEGDGSFVELQNETVSGRAKAVARAGGFPSIQTITAVADNAQKNIQLELMPVNINLTSSSLSVIAGTGASALDVTATSNADGGVTEGAKVKFFSTLGKVIGEGIVSSGRASATYNPSELTGTAIVTANIGNSYAKTQIQILPEPGLSLSFEPKVIVGDKTVDGSIDGETLTGTSTVAYKTSSILTINGIPGEPVEVQIKNNIEPVAWYLMNGLEGNIVEDIYHSHNGTATEVSLDIENFSAGGGSYKFNGISMIEIPDDQALHINKLALSVDVLPAVSDKDEAIIRKDGSYLFSIIKDGTSYRTKFDVYTDQGNYSITSSETLLTDQWNELYASFDNGLLKVAVNGHEDYIQVVGSLLYTDSSILVGKDFVGNIDNLQIIDLSRPGIVNFSDGSELFETILDPNGQAFITVYSTGNLRTQSPNEWFVYCRVTYKNISENPGSSKLAVVSSKLGWHIVNTVEGVVFGKGEGFGGAAGDIAASTVLYGDARDILQYCINVGFGVAELGEKLVCTFAIYGAVTTIAPQADVPVAIAKVAFKKIAGKPIAVGIEKIATKIISSKGFKELSANLDRYIALLTKLATDDVYESVVSKVFKNGTTATEKEISGFVESLAKIERKLSGQSPDLIKKLNLRFKNIPDVDADLVLRNTVEATAKILDRLEPLGIELTPDAVEGIGTLMRFTGRDKVTKIFSGNPEKANNIVDAILEGTPEGVDKGQVVNNIFTWLKEADDAAIPGLYNFASKLGNYPPFVQGGYHQLYYAKEIGFDKVSKFEAPIGNTARTVDIESTTGVLYEMKNTADYSFSGRLKHQFIANIKDLIEKRKHPNELIYIFRGSSKDSAGMINQMKEEADTLFKNAISDYRFDPKISIQFLNKEHHFYN